MLIDIGFVGVYHIHKDSIFSPLGRVYRFPSRSVNIFEPIWGMLFHTKILKRLMHVKGGKST